MNDKLDWLRRDFLSGGGMYGRFLSLDELEKSKLFLNTTEDFIESSESAEVANLSTGLGSLTAEQKDEYWQWNYPTHWQEVFATRIRSAFVTQLCSFVEAHLEELCGRVELIARVPLRLHDLKGSALSRPRKYLEAFAHFEAPTEGSWLTLERIFDVRNVTVHELGFAGKYRNEQKLRTFAESVPGLKFVHSSIELDRSFCEYCLSQVGHFMNQLAASYEAFRARSQVLEKLESSGGV